MADTIYDELTRFTYEALHTEALNAVADDVDKREGSVVFDMTAPAAMMIAKSFDVLYQVAMQSRIQTATGAYLDLCASQLKVYRNQARPAKWRIKVAPDTTALSVRGDDSQGTRFISTNGLNFIYEIIEIEDSDFCIAECLTVGAEGGRDFGELEETPITHDLTRVEFVKCVDGGSDVETDAAFRMRWWSTIKSKGYGGNFFDYKTWVLNDFAQEGGYSFDGMFIFPAYEGGGTVLIIPTIKDGDSSFMPPDAAAISALKTWIDPDEALGLGAGKAPVGHRVTVNAPSIREYHVSMTLRMAEGKVVTEALKAKIEQAIKRYFEQQRGLCATTLADGFPYSYELLISFSSIDAAIHAQSQDIISVTMLELSATIGGREYTYTTDFTLRFAADSVVLPVTGAFDIEEESDE